MKIPWRLGNREIRDRAAARSCVVANLALPGSGTLLAGSRWGFPQLILALAGFCITLFFGIPFLFWALRNWSRLQEPSFDPLENFLEIWRHSRASVFGLGLFLLSTLWSGASSLAIWSRAVRAERDRIPPKIS
jgi:hypothetical protein